MTREHMLKLLNTDHRMTRRNLDEYREIVVEYGITKTAEGSARVKIGDTEVLVGIKFELATPFPDTPDKGGIMVNAELTPMSSPDFESGPPGINSIELARVVDRGIRESGSIDFKKLCITEGEKVVNLIIDIVTINNAGNLFDASALAAIAALKDAKYPKIEDGKIDYKEITDKNVALEHVPVSCTVIKIGNKYLVDPDSDEESALDARLTVATLEDGSLCALQKGGDATLSLDDIQQMVGLAVRKCEELRGAL